MSNGIDGMNRAERRNAARGKAQRRSATRGQARRRKAARIGLATAVASSTVGALHIPGAEGATFTVTNLLDTGAGSLRQAIADAAVSPGPDTITFAPGLTGTITLASTLAIHSEVTITGPGADKITVSGNNAVRDFYLGEGPALGWAVTISGLSINDGSAPAHNSEGYGAGIRSNGAALTLDRVTMSGNSAYVAGAISSRNGGSVTISNSTISGNTASHIGGAIFVQNTPLTVSNTTLSGNTAGTYGGGAIWTDNSTVAISGSTLSGNSGPAGRGGALYLFYSSATITNTTISGNTIADGSGGGIYVIGGEAPVTVTIENSTLSANSAGQGGAIAGSSATITLKHSSLVDNVATRTIDGGRLVPGSAALPLPGPGNSVHLLRGGALTMTHTVVSGVTTNGSPDFNNTPNVTSNWSLIRDANAVVTGANNLIGVDPKLGPLAANGGATRTHLPLAGSPVINAGDPAVVGAPATDQRGLARIAEGRIDIGAVEYVTPPPPPPACDLNSFNPKRLLDTRTGIGGPKAKVGSGGVLTVQIAGVGGLPATGIKAVIVNLTAAQSTLPSFVTAWPADKARPVGSSTLNTEPGQDVPNLAIVELSADGKMSLYNSAGETNLIVDVMGYLGTCSTFTPVAPARILDTRTGNGAPAEKVGPAKSIAVQATGVGGVPATGVAAVVVNLTTTQADASSYVTAWPSGETRPTASTLNTEAGVDVPNLAVVKLGADGKFNLYNEAGSTHLLADVVGYFPVAAPALAPAAPASGFVATSPMRVLDSRIGVGFTGPAQAGRNYDVAITGVPAGIKAVVINLTATGSTQPGFVTAWAAGAAFPDTSNLNTEVGVNVANLAVVPVSADGKISLYNSHGTTHLVGDVVGYFPADAG